MIDYIELYIYIYLNIYIGGCSFVELLTVKHVLMWWMVVCLFVCLFFQVLPRILWYPNQYFGLYITGQNIHYWNPEAWWLTRSRLWIYIYIHIIFLLFKDDLCIFCCATHWNGLDPANHWTLDSNPSSCCHYELLQIILLSIKHSRIRIAGYRSKQGKAHQFRKELECPWEPSQSWCAQDENAASSGSIQEEELIWWQWSGRIRWEEAIPWGSKAAGWSSKIKGEVSPKDLRSPFAEVWKQFGSSWEDFEQVPLQIYVAPLGGAFATSSTSRKGEHNLWVQINACSGSLYGSNLILGLLRGC